MTRTVLLCAFGILFFLSPYLHAQPWKWNFGTSVDSCTQGVSTTLLPSPPSGNPRVRIGSQGGSIALLNPGRQQLGSESEVCLRAPTGGSLNKLQLYGFQSGNAFTMRCHLLFESAPATYYLFTGSGSCFSDNGGFTTAEIFTGIRWEIDSAGTIVTSLRDASSWHALSGLSLQAGVVYDLELYCNNSANARGYVHDSACTVGSRRLDLWIDGSRVATNAAKAGLPDTTSIDAFMFYGAGSPSNVSTLSIDDVHFDNDIASQPLPVELHGFRGRFDGSGIRLRWTTLTELNNHGFTVERRSDQSARWESVGFVAGRGSSAVPSAYTFRDSSASASGTYLYRLRQTDRDGTETLSPVIRVIVLPEKQGLDVGTPYPLPAHDRIMLPLTTTSDAAVEIRVFTLTGETVAELPPRRILPATERLITLPCAAWPRGSLFLDIRCGAKHRIRMLFLR